MSRTLRQSAVRSAVLAHRAARRLRCRIFELVGSARYSRTALFDLDRKLAPYLPQTGVFVEAGANDGFRQSNTYYLERCRGWTGVLIEPIPDLAAQCRKRRTRSRVFQCALVDAQHPTSEIVIRYADVFSEIVGARRARPESVWSWDKPYDVAVPARTLSDVLADAGVGNLDFLSLDLQGFEATALRGLDLERWRPTVMLIEIDDAEAQRAVDAVLGSHYDCVAWLTPHDVLYRSNTHPSHQS